jgi:hypothetical protein
MKNVSERLFGNIQSPALVTQNRNFFFFKNRFLRESLFLFALFFIQTIMVTAATNSSSAPVTQWIRRLPTEQEIVGSIPAGGTSMYLILPFEVPSSNLGGGNLFPVDGGEYQTMRIYVRDTGEDPGGLQTTQCV